MMPLKIFLAGFRDGRTESGSGGLPAGGHLVFHGTVQIGRKVNKWHP